MFEEKDLTIIGDKGINISGGQKVRLALARALYHQSEIYIFDDILSALDINVGSFIFNQTIKKYLKGKTILLATHNLNQIPLYLCFIQTKITY